MEVSKALVIARPWIGYILDGVKTWEMRSQKTTIRGWIALAEKGTGQLVGVARLVDSLEPRSKPDMLDSIGKHRIPAGMIESGEVDAWRFPWVLGDVLRFHRPIPYRHPPGAVTWVNLDADVRRQIEAEVAAAGAVHTSDRGSGHIGSTNREAQAGDAPQASPDALSPAIATKLIDDGNVKSSVASSSGLAGRVIGESMLSKGNLNNHHFYLTSFLKNFPADAIGGRNAGERAHRLLEIDWGDGEPASTDIDGTKNIFRARAWIRAFFDKHRVAVGDSVQVLELAPYRYRVLIKGH